MLRRRRLAMLVAEFLGTGVLTLAVLSVQRSQLGLAYFVAIAAGLAVALLTYVLGNVSGAHMNPALTLALWTARRVKTIPALTYIVAQLLGAWAAYGLYHYFVNTDVQAVTQAFSGRIMVAEAVGTMVFALAWAAAAYNRLEDGRFAAIAGLSFTLAVIVASAASVGLANPALAEGVRAWEVFGENGWGNYVLGPVLGAVIGVNLYGLLFADPDRPFGALRGRTATAGAGTTSTSVVEPADTDGDIDVDKAVNSNEKAGAGKVAPRSKVTKSAKTAAKKTTAKKTTSRKKS
ncbi:MAG: major intrinsic protein [Candidatus Saccharibacteria bacterium]|nr:major intrinsic protein [Candidatus Saccharibacteria bacterium]